MRRLATLLLLLGSQALAQAPGQPELPGRALGTSFSHVELAKRGIEPLQAFEDLAELDLAVVRLGAYWSEMEPSEGAFEPGLLPELLERAACRGQAVILTVGMKAPRWPEFYIPGWAMPEGGLPRNAEPSKHPLLRARALAFIERTVERLAEHRAIVAWQVENEPMDRSGEHGWFLGADYLREAVQRVRATDPFGRRIVVNAWSDDQRISSVPWGDAHYAARNALAMADVLGLDIYPRVGGEEMFAWRRVELIPWILRGMARKARRPVWVIESQAEPWDPSGCTPEQVRALVDRHLAQGMETVLLWGFEHWYERRSAGDPALWNAVRELSARFRR